MAEKDPFADFEVGTGSLDPTVPQSDPFASFEVGEGTAEVENGDTFLGVPMAPLRQWFGKEAPQVDPFATFDTTQPTDVDAIDEAEGVASQKSTWDYIKASFSKGVDDIATDVILPGVANLIEPVGEPQTLDPSQIQNKELYSQLQELGIADENIFQQWRRSVADDIRSYAREWDARNVEAMEDAKPDDAGYFTDVASSAAGSVPGILAGIGAAVVTRGASLRAGLGPATTATAETMSVLGVTGALSGLNKYFEDIDKGEEELNSTVDGVINGLVEAALAYPSVKAALAVGSPFVSRLVHTLKWEVPTEAATSLLQDLSDWALINPEIPAEDFWRNAAYNMSVAAGAAAGMAGTLATGGHAAEVGSKKALEALEGYRRWGELYERRSEAAEEAQANYDRLKGLMDSFETALATTVADEENENVSGRIHTIDRTELEKLAQDEGISLSFKDSTDPEVPISSLTDSVTDNQSVTLRVRINPKDKSKYDVYVPDTVENPEGTGREFNAIDQLMRAYHIGKQNRDPTYEPQIRPAVFPLKSGSHRVLPNTLGQAKPGRTGLTSDPSWNFTPAELPAWRKLVDPLATLRYGVFKLNPLRYLAFIGKQKGTDYAKYIRKDGSVYDRSVELSAFNDEVENWDPNQREDAPFRLFIGDDLTQKEMEEAKTVEQTAIFVRKKLGLHRVPLFMFYDRKDARAMGSASILSSKRDAPAGIVFISPGYGMESVTETILHELGHIYHGAMRYQMAKEGRLHKLDSIMRRLLVANARRITRLGKQRYLASKLLTPATDGDFYTNYIHSSGKEYIAQSTPGNFLEGISSEQEIDDALGSYAEAMLSLYREYKRVGAKESASLGQFYSRLTGSEAERRALIRKNIAMKNRDAALREWRSRSVIKRTRDRFGRAFNGLSKVRMPTAAGIKAPMEQMTRLLFKKTYNAVDQYNWFIEKFWGVHHLAWLNKHIGPLQEFNRTLRQAFAYKANWQQKGVTVVKRWGEIVRSAEDAKLFDEFLFFADARSHDEKRLLTDMELEALTRQVETLVGAPMRPEIFQLAKDFWGHYRDVLAEMQAITEANFQGQLQELMALPLTAENSVKMQALNEQLVRVRQEFQEMAQRHWVPHTRFGNYFLHVRAPDAKGRFKTIAFEAYETYGEALLAAEDIQKFSGGAYSATVSEKPLNDNLNMIRGLPPQLQRFLLEAIQKHGSLTPQEVQQIQSDLAQLNYELAPERSGWKKFIRRKNTKGYSHNAVRVLAEYNVRLSGHMMRLSHFQLLRDQIQGMSDYIKGRMQAQLAAGDMVQDVTKLNRIQGYMKRLYEHILNPGNELASLKALGFLWYMGFNVKSAIVNLSQTPVVTYPHLAAKYGDKKALAAIYGVMKDYRTYWEGKKKGRIGSVEEQLIWDDLVRSGIVDESFAAEMSSLSEGSSIQRALPIPFVQQVMGGERTTLLTQKAIDSATYMFAYMERRNREIAARAAIRLALAEGHPIDLVREMAYDTVMLTQGEYSSWTRGEWLRGKAGILFLFKQFMLNMLFFMKNDPGRMRTFLMLGILGGYQGLPFAEDIIDIFNFLATEFKEWTGWKNPKTDMRIAARRFFEEMLDFEVVEHYLGGADRLSDLLAKGLGAHLGPWDISASLGMGDIIPGTGALNHEGRWPAPLFDAGQEFAGAFAAIPMNFLAAINSDSPDFWRNWEKAMPAFVRGLSSAQRTESRGFDSNNQGYRMDTYNPNSLTDKIALYGQGLGFSRRSVTKHNEEAFMVEQVITYYNNRRAGLLKEYFFLKETMSNPEEAQDFLENEIADFNNQVPLRAWKIDRKDLARSKEARSSRQEQVLSGEASGGQDVREYSRELLNPTGA